MFTCARFARMSQAQDCEEFPGLLLQTMLEKMEMKGMALEDMERQEHFPLKELRQTVQETFRLSQVQTDSSKPWIDWVSFLKKIRLPFLKMFQNRQLKTQLIDWT